MKNRAVSSGEKATSLRYNLMELAAEKNDVISLGRGDPDLDTPAEIIEGTWRRMKTTPSSIPVRGLLELRRSVSDHERLGLRPGAGNHHYQRWPRGPVPDHASSCRSGR